MRLLDLVSRQLSNSLVLTDPIWQAPAGAVTSFQLTLFRARMSAHGLARQGDEAVDVLLTEGLRYVLANNVSLPFLDHPVTAPRFMADELADGLRAMPHVKAQAALLALEERRSLNWAMTLTWKQVLKMSPGSSLSTEILRQRNRCRHIRLDYVFWHFMTGEIAGPVLDLSAAVTKAFRFEWVELQLAYTRLVMVDRPGDAVDLKLLID